MRRGQRLWTAVAAVTLAAVAAAQDPPAALDPQEMCTARCHQDLAAGEFRHAPAEDGECTGCHQQADEARHEFAAIDEPSASCRLCHEVRLEAHVHPPVADGECTDCHDPHRSADSALLRSADVNSLCALCHDPILAKTEKEFVHGPVASGKCTLCHDPHSAPQPKLLAQEPVEFCVRCHEDQGRQIEAADVVHGPAAFDCSLCHDPHGSDLKYQLKGAAPELCYGCHDELKATTQSAALTHGALAVGESCLSCHRPHVARFAGLLDRGVRDLCVGCHDRPVPRADGGPAVAAIGREIATAEHLHGPIRDGTCTPCHRPHASDHQALLVAPYPARFYAPYESRRYELCFGCHERKVFETERTSSLTGFRDGDQNLHFVHVSDPAKGRSCGACHTIHGGSQRKLVAVGVPFGGWTMPLAFEKLETGGSCARACHVARTYKQ